MIANVEIFHENAEVVSIFSQIGGQWRTGASGPIGLDYNVVFTLLDRRAGDAWEDFFEDIRALENAALQAMSEAK